METVHMGFHSEPDSESSRVGQYGLDSGFLRNGYRFRLTGLPKHVKVKIVVLSSCYS
jgi:hypothetical protein